MCLVRFFQVPADPYLEIGTRLRPWILCLRPYSVQRGETNPERHVFNVVLRNDIILACRDWRKFQHFQECFTSEAPSLLVPVRESFRVCKCLSEGYHCGFAIERPSKLLRLGKDEVEVDGSEKPIALDEYRTSRKRTGLVTYPSCTLSVT